MLQGLTLLSGAQCHGGVVLPTAGTVFHLTCCSPVPHRITAL